MLGWIVTLLLSAVLEATEVCEYAAGAPYDE